MLNCYKFSSTATPVPPETDITRLLDKAFTKELLTQQEKVDVARALFGVFGAHGDTYRLAGWAWPMRTAPQFRRILVAFDHNPDEFRAFYAPNKSSLRLALSTSDEIEEMIYTQDGRNASDQEETE